MIGRRDFIKLSFASLAIPFAGLLGRSNTVLPTESVKIAESLAELARRVKALEALQRMDLGTSRFEMRGPLAIPDSVYTTISLTSADLGSAFSWDIADPTKIFCLPARDNTWFCILGQICQWEFSGVASTRGVQFSIKTAGGVPLSNFTPFHIDCPTTAIPFFPMTGGIIVNSPTDYMEVNVYQDTGGPLNLIKLSFFTFLIK